MNSNGPPRNYCGALEANLKICAKWIKLRVYNNLLKPDLTAPGDMVTNFSHLRTAYIKSFHPTWSPTAIKSALMTIATPMSAKKKNPEAKFAYGAGNIDPGLVYDADEIDYVKFLCGQGYSTRALWPGASRSPRNPSLACSVGLSQNIGSSVSTYKATVIGASEGLEIQVEPSILSFTSLMQKLSFVLKVEGKVGDNIVSASLVWDDGVHQVRTPIVVLALT
ncbi:Cucumisin [Vitis vinifera]|uniref:Cucumisin n=1 Tax=Vitis vinifera TaxID=29760 RepID=A0A438JXZ8_VITVI|nr:Cucumisin [Vitis vinifera]